MSHPLVADHDSDDTESLPSLEGDHEGDIRPAGNNSAVIFSSDEDSQEDEALIASDRSLSEYDDSFIDDDDRSDDWVTESSQNSVSTDDSYVPRLPPRHVREVIDEVFSDISFEEAIDQLEENNRNLVENNRNLAENNQNRPENNENVRENNQDDDVDEYNHNIAENNQDIAGNNLGIAQNNRVLRWVNSQQGNRLETGESSQRRAEISTHADSDTDELTDEYTLDVDTVVQRNMSGNSSDSSNAVVSPNVIRIKRNRRLSNNSAETSRYVYESEIVNPTGGNVANANGINVQDVKNVRVNLERIDGAGCSTNAQDSNGSNARNLGVIPHNNPRLLVNIGSVNGGNPVGLPGIQRTDDLSNNSVRNDRQTSTNTTTPQNNSLHTSDTGPQITVNAFIPENDQINVNVPPTNQITINTNVSQNNPLSISAISPQNFIIASNVVVNNTIQTIPLNHTITSTQVHNSTSLVQTLTSQNQTIQINNPLPAPSQNQASTSTQIQNNPLPMSFTSLNPTMTTTQVGNSAQNPIDIDTIASPVNVCAKIGSPLTCSQSNFKTPKRKRVPTPEKKMCDSDDEEGCPICLEEWTTTGTHRLVSLKCGHLFGQKCIEKWMNTKKSCPQCNAKARKLDIRPLYAGKVKAVDTSDRDEALKNLEKERTLRGKAEMETAEIRLQHQLRLEEVNRLKAQLDAFKHSTPAVPTPEVPTKPQHPSNTPHYTLQHSITINEAGGCRVLAYSPSVATLVISQNSSNPLFPGYGFKKLSCLDFKTSQNITFHSKPIRDACFHPSRDNGILLSCAMDKTLKLTNIHSNNILHTYTAPQPIWSCTYHSDNDNLFYAGLQNGNILEFDLRNTSTWTQSFCTKGSQAPVVALQYVAQDQQAAFRLGGLLVGQLDRVTFYEKKAEDFKPHIMPLEGSLTSLRLEPTTRHFLASFRPTAKHATARHTICELSSNNISGDPGIVTNAITSQPIHTFTSGNVQKLLSKTALIAHGVNKEYVTVFSGNEAQNKVQVWDVASQTLTQTIPNQMGPVLDLCAFNNSQNTFLATLTEKQLRIYKGAT